MDTRGGIPVSRSTGRITTSFVGVVAALTPDVSKQPGEQAFQIF
jgi:hypothetical protein